MNLLTSGVYTGIPSINLKLLNKIMIRLLLNLLFSHIFLPFCELFLLVFESKLFLINYKELFLILKVLETSFHLNFKLYSSNSFLTHPLFTIFYLSFFFIHYIFKIHSVILIANIFLWCLLIKYIFKSKIFKKQKITITLDQS